MAMRFFKSRSGLLYSPVLILSLLGCSGAEDFQVTDLRNQLLLQSEPKGISLTQAKSLLETEAEVVLVGRIGSGKLDPFDKSKASFVLSEAPADHGDKGHDASECPFCKRRAEEAPIANIEMIDKSGKPIALGAEKLLGVHAGQIVVVQGKGTYLADVDTLQISGSKIFIRP
jgi:hypothetical protein